MQLPPLILEKQGKAPINTAKGGQDNFRKMVSNIKTNKNNKLHSSIQIVILLNRKKYSLNMDVL